MMFHGMVGGLRTLIWSIVVLIIPVYLLGFLLSQTIGVQEGGPLMFKSVATAMFTVVRCMTGECTDKDGRPLVLVLIDQYGWQFALYYAIFILFTLFGLFNLITAIFVENTVAA